MQEDEIRPDQPRSVRSVYSDDPEMRALLAFFLGDLDRRVTALRRALDASDLADLRKLAHQLSGTAGGYGYPTIGDAARDLESGLPSRTASRTAVGSSGDGLAEEAALSSVSERAETLIGICRDAIRTGRRDGYTWGLDDAAPVEREDDDPFGFDDGSGMG